MKKSRIILMISFILIGGICMSLNKCITSDAIMDILYVKEPSPEKVSKEKIDNSCCLEKAALHAEYQTEMNTTYDGSYKAIGYPGGDVGYRIGVCTDVVIRALRSINIDLQELIHNDMKANLDIYNKRYRTTVVDKNIDHRRTQNIQTYLTRIGANIKVPQYGYQYDVGDILFWDIAAGHTGIVVDKVNWEGDSHLVVHNIGGGAQYEDMLNSWPPDEVYRLTPAMIKKMQLDCTFEYDIDKDFMYYGN